MKTTIKVEKEVEFKTLAIEAGVRYWEDTIVNGVEDESGDLIPFRKDEYWCPVIDIDSGAIKDWPKGTIAEIHYKVCDDFSCSIKDENGNLVFKAEDQYVPDILCPKEQGFGDYIIMDIDENGKIRDWDAEELLNAEFFE